MKQYIVLIGMIVLGVSLYMLIAGPGEDSWMHLTGQVLRAQLAVYR
ncbi:MAG: hypothetical protein LBN36_04915 [Clostridiales Family XIII bacterium]|jgi:hypothetical protein|nr:hypothetical protein [Clostridiales Family XIII bacterium]